MTASDVQEAIAAGRFDELEDEWLARLESEPEDVGFFARIARLLEADGESERAAALLELADEHLAGDERWQARLELLRTAPAWLDPERLHGEIVRSLQRLYRDSPSYSGLAEHVGLFRAVTDIPKIWRKVDRLRALLAYEVGSVVWMEGKGAGTVVEVNLALESFRVDFDRAAGLTVGFGGAVKLLEPVPPGHILHRRLTDPAPLQQLKQDDPAALLGEVLSSYDRPLAAGRIREILADLIGDSEWSAWWAAARRHPRLVTSGKGARQVYAWAASADAATDEIQRAFEAGGATEKLAAYRKHADRDPELRRRMEQELMLLGERLAAERPAEAMAVYTELERRRAAPEQAAWSPRALLTAAAKPVQLVVEIDDRQLREQAVDLLAERRDDWSDLYLQLLAREPDPRILDRLAERLAAERPESLAAFIDRTLSEPRKLPFALVWLGERVAGDWQPEPRQALKLLQQLLVASRHRPFTPLRPRLNRMYEAGGPFPRLMARLEESQAAAAARAIARAPLDAGIRKALSDALELRFPSLRKGGVEPLYALRDSIDAKRAELRRLLEEEIPANRRAIEEAREMGDLRENFEYKAARQRHEYLAARSAALQRDLARAKPIEQPAEAPRTVAIGCRVELRGDGGSSSLTILGPWESDPERAIVSYESDLARRLLGRQVGDKVRLAEGERTVGGIEPAAETGRGR